MPKRVRITILVENTARKRNLLAEHGFSVWIETDANCVLFDTGQANALLHNVGALKLDMADVDAIVLSHGHYDHTGCLRFALNSAPQAMLYLHPQALRARYAGRPGEAREIGLASITESEIRRQPQRLVWTTEPTQVVPGVFATGEIPRKTELEDTGGDFYLHPDCREPDPIIDDQAIYVDTRDGLVVILGCAHAGVINTLNRICEVTGRPIHAVIGGTHLVNASSERIAWTIEELRARNIKLLAPGHCTGPTSTAALWTAFPKQISDCSVGTTWTFPLRTANT